ncbi:hypothetical protein WEH80_36635 [Actinomycetes bacterium KLBMP 9759]
MRVGRFELMDMLRADATASTFLGRAPGGVLAAVTVPHDTFQADRGFRATLTAALAAARRARAPWVLAVLDADVENDRMWWATEHIPGLTLEEHVRGSGPLPERMLFVLAGRMADALAGLHATGGAHGNLTPSSIVLADDGPYLADIVDAALADTGLPCSDDARRRHPSDVYALAVVLLFAASGRQLLDGTDGSSSTLPQSAREFLPSPLLEHITPCLAADPSARPSARELASRLAVPTPDTGVWTLPTIASPTAEHPHADGTATEFAPPDTPRPHRRRPTTRQVVGGTVACAAAACILAVVIPALNGPPSPPSSPVASTATTAPLPPDGPGAQQTRLIEGISTFADWVERAPDGTRVYTPGERDYATIIDTTQNAMTGTIDADIHIRTAPTASADGQRLYAARRGFRGENQLLVIDAKTHRQIDAIDIPNLGDHVAVSGDGRRAYIAVSTESAGYGVDVIDLASRSLVTRIPFTVVTYGRMTFSPNGRYLHVPGYENAVIDTVTNTKTTFIPEPPPPGHRAHFIKYTTFSMDGRIGFQLRDDRIVVMDGHTMAHKRTVAPDLIGALPEGRLGTISTIAASPSGRHLFLAVYDLGSTEVSAIAVVDTTDFRLVDSIKLSSVPRDMTISPDGHTLYAPASDNTGTLMVIDVSKFV